MINYEALDQDVWYKRLVDLTAKTSISSDHLLDQIGMGISFFCNRYNLNILTRNDLTLLVSRSLVMMGLKKEAKELLYLDPFYKKQADSWIMSFSVIEKFSEIYPFLSKQIISPKSWLGSTEQNFWVLNLKLLSINENEFHEVIVYRSLKKIINPMIPIWNNFNGIGTLGIKGLKAGAINKLFPLDRAGYSSEIIDFLNDVFIQNKNQFHWKSTPNIMVI
tara:strand:- start:74 stop:733 length:660 start_codon:yes stop_codon:yes gene_type:complete